MFFKVGHRGAKGLEPENTLRAFKKALNLGMDMIECDVRLTKDNQLVIIHDRTVNRTANGKGRVNKLTLAEIKNLDAGNGEKVPTLSELFVFAKDRCQLNVEVKNRRTGHYLIKELKQISFPHKDLIISSNYLSVLNKVKSQFPQLKTAWTFRSIESDLGQTFWLILSLLTFPLVYWYVIHRLKHYGIERIDLQYSLASKKFIDKVHRSNKKIFVWTVDGKKKIEKFRKLGVDGIITNYPNRL